MQYEIGTYIKAVRNVYADVVIAQCSTDGTMYGVVADYTSTPILVPKEWVVTSLQRGEIEIPEGRYEIWGDNECTCGAKHTSFPSIHLTYCMKG